MKNIRILALIFLLTGSALAQGTGFHFQGRLNDGTNPANGQYDLQFSLHTAITGGTQIGSTIASPNTPLINGVFSTTLDFGSTAFNNPNSVFIEISVKPGGSPNAYTVLGPRQQLTVVPFAVRAMNATNATNADSAVNAQFALNAQNAGNAANLGLQPASEYVTKTNGGADFIRNSIAPVANQNFNIVGNGVINGTLNVAGNTTIGSPTITSNLNVSGSITAAGNAAQNRDKSGFVKAMLFANENGVIQRCFNAVSGASTGNCGITIQHPSAGIYDVYFPFQVDDRFFAITAEGSLQVTLVASFVMFPLENNSIRVFVNITDVDHNNSRTDGDFMLLVY